MGINGRSAIPYHFVFLSFRGNGFRKEKNVEERNAIFGTNPARTNPALHACVESSLIRAKVKTGCCVCQGFGVRLRHDVFVMMPFSFVLQVGQAWSKIYPLFFTASLFRQ